jgi:hypothetical protein
MRNSFFGLVMPLGLLFRALFVTLFAVMSLAKLAVADEAIGSPLHPRDPLKNPYGETIVFQCEVPVSGDESSVTLEMTLGDDLSIDFLTITLNDLDQSHIFFTQMAKGKLRSDIKAGKLDYLLVTEDTIQTSGIVRKSGYLVINKDEPGVFSGFISALGNLYPLACEAK